MLPFRVELTPGASPYRQLVHAATRAIVSGEVAVGAPFPSVRVLSQSLKLNPNTAQKAVSELVRAGLLEVHSGVGTVVAAWDGYELGAEEALPWDVIERLVVDARRLGVSRLDLRDGIDRVWTDLFGQLGTSRPKSSAKGA